MPENTKHALDVVQVGNPCDEPWSKMSGDEQVRFCGLCEKHVFNLSKMTRDEAEQVLEERVGRICVRFYRRADGTVGTIDCAPIRFAAARKIARQTLRGAAAMMVSLLTLVFGLSLFRLSGLDVSSWLEDTAVARLAKAVEPVIEPQVESYEMGEEIEHYEMGEEAEPIEPVRPAPPPRFAPTPGHDGWSQGVYAP